MGVIITQYGKTILSSPNMSMVPRIGETVQINTSCYKVKDVVWHADGRSVFVEIKIE